MNTAETLSRLKEVHAQLIQDVLSLSEAQFLAAPAGKWNAGEHLQHLHISVQATLMVMSNPKFISAEALPRERMSFEQLVTVYLDGISKGLKAPPNFVPATVDFQQRAATADSLSKLVNSISEVAAGKSEAELDELTVPHPALKRLTMREMLYFTIYHCEHHHALMLKAVAG